MARLWPDGLEGAGLAIQCCMGSEAIVILVDHLLGGYDFQASRYTVERVSRLAVADVGEVMLVVVMLGRHMLGIAAPYYQIWCCLLTLD